MSWRRRLIVVVLTLGFFAWLFSQFRPCPAVRMPSERNKTPG